MGDSVNGELAAEEVFDEEDGADYSFEIIATETVCEGRRARVYGIEAEMREGGKLVSSRRLEDIFCTRAEAESFASVLRECKLDPCHLADAAEDWLAAGMA